MQQDTTPDPLLTLVICARNDQHVGNSRWRLQTTLNFLGVSARESLGHHGVEVIVCDWGSEIPLRQVLELDADAAKITRFLEVPPALAAEKQQDSPFCEVLANNSSIRRARGRFIGRIDQDTLVGNAFLTGFRDWLENRSADETDTGFMFVGRRSIPQSFVEKDPPFPVVREFVSRNGARLPREGIAQKPWFDAPVGVVIMHRDLWRACHGYDERLIYWGFMETDLALRVAMKSPVINLEKALGCQFYHLAHGGRSFRSTSRTKNPRTRPREYAPSGADWGLAGHDLELRRAVPADTDAPAAQPPGQGPSTPTWSVAAEWAWQIQCGVLRFIRGLFKGDRITGRYGP